jgi:peptide deformylase
MRQIIPPESNPLLYQQIEKYNFSNTDIDLKSIIDEMIAYLKTTSNGYALAANQLGIKLRAFIIGETVYINPEIVKSWNKQTGVEGCLSFPNEWIEKTRAEKIQVKFQDIHGNRCERTFTGLKSRAFQHELDHLNGICFNDSQNLL